MLFKPYCRLEMTLCCYQAYFLQRFYLCVIHYLYLTFGVVYACFSDLINK